MTESLKRLPDPTPPESTPPSSLFDRRILPVFLIILVDQLAFMTIQPLLPFYAQMFGSSMAVVGVLGATYGFFQIFSGPVLGALSDRIGRRPVLLVSQIGTLFGLALLGVANSPGMIFLSRAIDGCTGGNTSVAYAHVADVSDPKHRTHLFGKMALAIAVGFLLGPPLSGLLAKYDYRLAVASACLLTIVSIAATMMIFPTDKTRAGALPGPSRPRASIWQSYVSLGRRKPVLKALLEIALYHAAFGAFFGSLSLYAERRFQYAGKPFGPAEVGLLYSFWAGISIVMQALFVRPLAERFTPRQLSLGGLVMMCTGYVFMCPAQSLAMYLGACFVCSVGSQVARPSLMTLLSKSAGPTEQGTVLGMNQTLASLGFFVGPFLGALMVHYWLEGWALLPALFCAAAILLALSSRYQTKLPGPSRFDSL